MKIISLRFEFKYIIISITLLVFVLAQVSGRIDLKPDYNSIALCKPAFQYGYPVPYIETNGGRFHNSYINFKDKLLTTTFFTPVKPCYFGPGREVIPQYTSYFLWDNNNYYRVSNSIKFPKSDKVYFTDQIVDSLTYYLSLSVTVSQSYDNVDNILFINIENIPWRCILFNVIYFVITILGIHLFFKVSNRIVNRIIFYPIFSISVIVVLVSIHNIFFETYTSYNTFWFYNLLYSINVQLFIVSILGYMIVAVKAIKKLFIQYCTF